MTSGANTKLIQENYTVESMADRVKQALANAGLGSGPLQWSDLASFDQFHVRGLEATKELAEALQLKSGQFLLDVGSGLGGAARYLAAVYGVQVTGIDLTPVFIEIAEYLSARAGLQGRTTFRQGDATELSFPDKTFDAAWTQHVAMNIENKPKLYKALHRVLKPGGQLAIYDPIRGNHQPLIYPTPWAREESISFVATESDIKEALAAASFQIRSFIDKTEIAAQWFREMQQQREKQTAQQTPPNPLNPMAVLGPEMGPAVANFARNVLEGRIRIVQVIAEKSYE
jgi:ubiquinone/menaquinone biosynthesis C-methylase UbiE